MSNPVKSIPGVGAVVFKDDKILLVKRRYAPNAGQWAIPGGKIKPGETLQLAAEREIVEETGITIKAQQAFYSFDVIHDTDVDNIQHYMVFDVVAEYISGSPVANSDAAEARWISRKELKSLNVNAITLMVLKLYFNYE